MRHIITTFGASLVLAGCPDHELGRFNSPPEVVITSHAQEFEGLEGFTYTFRAQASDPDDDADKLTMTWRYQDEIVCEPQQPNEDGSSECEITVGAVDGDVIVEVTDIDAAGASAIVSVIVVPTEPPTGIIQSPTPAGKFYSNHKVTFQALLADNEDDPKDLVATWQSDIDGPISANGTPDASGLTSGASFLTEGQHFIELKITDTTDKQGTDSVVITVGPPNTPPTCAITAPDSGGAVQYGELITFLGVAEDVDIPSNWLEVEWSSDKDGVIGSSTPDSSGNVTFPFSGLSGDTHVITMTVRDEVGADCSTNMVYSVGNPPEVIINEPATGATANEGEAIIFDATVSDTEDIPTDVDLVWNSDIDGDFSTAGSDSTGLVRFSTSSLSAGSHTITVTATDTAGLTALAYTTIDLNGAPSQPGVSLQPNPADTTDDVSVSIDSPSVDPEGSPVTYTYDWYKNGTLSSASITATLPNSATRKGETWSVEVTPTDGMAIGPSGTAAYTIANAAPVLASVKLGPTTPTTTDTLNCRPGIATDADGDTVTFSYSWTKNSSPLTATTAALSASDHEKGDVISCTVTPTDGTATGVAITSASVTIENTAPVLSSATLSPLSATESDTLSCTAGTTSDADGDTVTNSYRWIVNTTTLAVTSDTLTGSHFNKTDSVVCGITPFDGTDSGSEVTSATATITNTPPTLSGVTLGPSSPTVSDTLSCTVGTTSDVDGDVVSVNISWNVNGSGVSATGGSLSSTYFQKGDDVVCIGTPNDGTIDGTSVASSTVTIRNSAPTVTSVTLSPGTLTTNDSVTCVPSGATDPDGDTVSFNYVWTVNSAPVSFTTATLSNNAFTRNDTVRCTATPTDGMLSGSPVSSPTVTVGNTPPTVSSASITPTSPGTNDTLTCSSGATADDDGDTVTVSYTWAVNGTTIGVTGNTLASSHFNTADAVTCSATPYDGTSYGAPATSPVTTIANTLPVLSSASLTPSSPKEADTVVCVPGSATDADGHPVSFKYAWTVNSVSLSTTASSITGASFDKGDVIGCTITPNDGYGDGTSVAATSVTAVNSAPTVPTPSLSPNPANVTHTLSCVAATPADADGDSVNLTYSWRVNAASVSPTTSTLSSTWFNKGDQVQCIATPNDGTISGTSMASPLLTISNALPSVSGLSIRPNPAVAASTLTCAWSTFSDPDGDSDNSTVTWTIGGSSVGTGTTLSGAFLGSETVTCTVTPNDGTSNGTPKSTSITISNTAPVLSGVTLSPSGATESSTLTCTPGSATDADFDIVTFKTAWTVNGSSIAPTTTTLTGTHFDRYDVVRCVVTPTDGMDDGTPVTSSGITIRNSAPVMNSITWSHATAYTDTLLAATPSATDPDTSDTISYTYEWYVNGVKQAVTGYLLEGDTYFDKGDKVYVTITPSDGTDSGVAMTSTTLTIANSLPPAPILAMDPAAPVDTYDDVYCTIATPSTDKDGDTVTYTFSWKKNGANWTGARTTTTNTGDTIPHANATEDDVWTCIVTPNDGTANGTDGTVDATIAACVGRAPHCPAESCKEVLDEGASIGNGNYYLDPSGSGTNIIAYCDMSLDGGGWTLIAQGGYDNCGDNLFCTTCGISTSTHMRDTDSCSYLPYSDVADFASVSTEVMLTANEVSSTFGSWEEVAYSTNSNAISAFSTATGTWHNGAKFDNWIWSHTCTPHYNTGWPNMYHACGSSTAVHWLSTHRSMDHGSEDSTITGTWVR